MKPAAASSTKVSVGFHTHRTRAHKQCRKVAEHVKPATLDHLAERSDPCHLLADHSAADADGLARAVITSDTSPWHLSYFFCRRRFLVFFCARGSFELSQRQRVAVRIAEPRDSRAARGRPDPEIVLRHAPIPLEHDAAFHEVAHGFRDVRHDPAEDRVTGRMERLHDGDAKHRPAGVECQGEAILADQTKSQRFGVEGFRAFGIGRRDERDDGS